MQKKQQRYIPRGMKRDISISKGNNEFSFENRNIRITTDGDNSLLTITTEKSTAKANETSIIGEVLGHCVINDKVVIFSTTNQMDYIYLFDGIELTTLYSGNLNFNKEFPIETLASYETQDVQKVYWVDNRNEPRVINIVDPRLKEVIPKDYFDFTSDLRLEETLSISKHYSSGLFPAGVIQYAFTYFNLYGKESNLVSISDLQYITKSDRAASPEEVTDTSFEITIDNVDTNFDYLRLYSIQRTSINDVPNVYKIIDIKLDKNTTKVTYIDNNRNTEIVDNTLLYYVGGESIIPKTLTQKDGTLFLGNYTLKNRLIEDSDLDIIKSEISIEQVLQEYENKDHIFENNFKLDGSEKDITTFKYNERYYLGIQFQYSNGKYSEPIFLKSIIVTEKNRIEDDKLKLVRFSIGNISQPILDIMTKYGFKRIRPLVQYPTDTQRRVICQGVVNPTVFNMGDRKTDSPYSQSSWFFRPVVHPSVAYNKVGNVRVTSLKPHNPEFRHYFLLPDNKKFNAEIQQHSYDFSPKFVSRIQQDLYSLPVSVITSDNDKGCDNYFAVDNSIVTVNSPDLDDNFNLNTSLTSMNIIGLVPITAFSSKYSNISIHHPITHIDGINTYGETKVLLESTTNGIINSTDSVSTALSGPYWRDWVVYSEDVSKPEVFYSIYPWHSSGPLNNDKGIVIQNNKASNRGVLENVLNTKTLTGFKYSRNNEYINDISIPLRSTEYMNTLQPKLIQIQSYINNRWEKKFYSSYIDKILTPTNWMDGIQQGYNLGVYSDFGNWNDLINKATDFKRWKEIGVAGTYRYKEENGTISQDGFNKYPNLKATDLGRVSNFFGSDKPTSMKYKSTRHLICSLGNYEDSQYTLPSLRDIIEDNSLYITSNSYSLEGLEGSPHYLILKVAQNGILSYEEQWVEGIPNPDGMPQFNHLKARYYIKANIAGVDPLDLQLFSKMYDTTMLSPVYNILSMYPRSIENLIGSGVDNLINFTTENNQNIDDIIIDYIKIFNEDFFRKVYNAIMNRDSNTSYRNQIINLSTVFGNFKFRTPIVTREDKSPFLYLADIMNESSKEKTLDEINTSQWLIAGKSFLPSSTIIYDRGDTYYQRYECIKTLPIKDNDPNRVVEAISFMVETRVNLEGRYDRNKGKTDYSYVTEDTYTKINPIYSQRNNYFTYRHLDKKRFNNNYFPNQITWSKNKSVGSLTDVWTNITLASTLDLDSNKGRLNLLTKYNNEITFFQDNGIGNILFNSRVQIPVTDGVPIEISNSLKVDGKRYISEYIGCQNKWSVCSTPNGMYFIDNNSNTYYLLNSNVSPLSDINGFRDFFKDNYSELEYYPNDNPTNFISFYDEANRDVYLSKGNTTLNYSEQLQAFESFYDYHNVRAMFNIKNRLYSISGSYIWKHGADGYLSLYGKKYPFSIEYNINPEGMNEKIFTNIELRADSFRGNETLKDIDLKTVEIENEYQTTKSTLKSSDTLLSNKRKKFRVWRANIPRPSILKRVRNPWIKLKLKSNLTGNKTTIHDLTVTYYE